MQFTEFMNEAIIEAQKAAALGEIPVGAVIVSKGEIIARAHNHTKGQKTALAHAEIIALASASNLLKKERLNGCDLYVTLEPCAMCAGAISHFRISRLYFGAYDAKSGGVCQGASVFDHPQTHHKPEVYGGIKEEACSWLLKSFFEQIRSRDLP